ncbi:MAG: hypothetical protein KatS3mg107_0914 [Gemmataceae bacterium]|jgi:hypothetical protein|nr:MAG: hypothetical protein KatS3mg107_0914 [Gemmataceae bacterium]
MITIGEKFAGTKGLSRRTFLRVGSLGLGGFTLPWLLTNKAAAGDPGKSYVWDKSVILLCLHGGPSQLETWDPKPEAPSETRSLLGVISTRLPGVQFGSTFPKMAALPDRLAIVRSFATGNALHSDLAVAVAGNRLKAVQGAIYARLAGSINPRTHVPNHVLLTPAAVGFPQKEPIERGPIHLMNTGLLSVEFQPIKPVMANISSGVTNYSGASGGTVAQ